MHESWSSTNLYTINNTFSIVWGMSFVRPLLIHIDMKLILAQGNQGISHKMGTKLQPLFCAVWQFWMLFGWTGCMILIIRPTCGSILVQRKVVNWGRITFTNEVRRQIMQISIWSFECPIKLCSLENKTQDLGPQYDTVWLLIDIPEV